MINPEDLRIGDYVRVCGDKSMIEKGKLCEVVGIDSEMAFLNKKGVATQLQLDREEWDYSHSVWCNDIEGIPITKKFLINNNFEETEHKITEDCLEWYAYKHKDSCIGVLYYPLTDDFFAFYCNERPCKIAYVHELQNILAAVKENIEITV